jgi:hypothetical protein
VGLTVRPRATAFRARSPAASITDGFEVLVQEVMAAMTTSPWPTSTSASSSRGRGRAAVPPAASGVGRLFTISYSESVEVSLRAPLVSESGSCRPPPGASAPALRAWRQRRPSSPAGFP